MKREKRYERRGRPSLDKATRAYTIDKPIAMFLDALPEGERSKFVNDWLRQHPQIAEQLAH